MRVAALGAFVALSSFAQDGKEPADLTKNRKIYLKALAKIETKHKDKVTEFNKQHVRNLVKIKTYYAKKGDLDAALATDADIRKHKAAMENGEAVAIDPPGDPKDNGGGRPVKPTVNRKPGKPMSLSKLGLDLVPIKAGSYTGSREKSSGYTVKLTRNYWMGKCEITVSQYAAVLGQKPVNGANGNMPVSNVSWQDAAAFCQKLTALEKAAGKLPRGYVYRLPTDAEWEYACLAGAKTLYFFGDDTKVAHDYCWVSTNSNNVPHEVGKKKPNPWGLHDIYGNVAEWCHDRGGATFTDGATLTDPMGPAEGKTRVYRGGNARFKINWLVRGENKRTDPEHKNENLGFRVALAPELK